MENRKMLQVTVPLTKEYENAFLNILPTEIDISLCLQEGEHRVTTEPVEIGGLKQFSKSPLVAQLTIWYEYRASENVLALCGDDLVSPDSMHLTVGTGDKTQNMIQFIHRNPTDQEKIGDGVLNSPLTSGFQTQIAGCLKQANARILEQTKEMGVVVLLRTALPHLSEDAYQRMSPVYRNGEFVEFFDPDKIYGPEYTIKGVQSIFNGLAYFLPTQDFANVIGSTGDPHGDEYKTWIGLWEGKTGLLATVCSSSGFPAPFTCNPEKKNIIGGHVIYGQTAQSVPSGGEVYIIPICKRHNSNNTCYMQPTQNNVACWMKNYMRL